MLDLPRESIRRLGLWFPTTARRLWRETDGELWNPCCCARLPGSSASTRPVDTVIHTQRCNCLANTIPAYMKCVVSGVANGTHSTNAVAFNGTYILPWDSSAAGCPNWKATISPAIADAPGRAKDRVILDCNTTSSPGPMGSGVQRQFQFSIDRASPFEGSIVCQFYDAPYSGNHHCANHWDDAWESDDYDPTPAPWANTGTNHDADLSAAILTVQAIPGP